MCRIPHSLEQRPPRVPCTCGGRVVYQKRKFPDRSKAGFLNAVYKEKSMWNRPDVYQPSHGTRWNGKTLMGRDKKWRISRNARAGIKPASATAIVAPAVHTTCGKTSIRPPASESVKTPPAHPRRKKSHKERRPGFTTLDGVLCYRNDRMCGRLPRIFTQRIWCSS